MLKYKIDVLKELKEKGYNTGVLRREKLLSESAIQKLREGRPIAWESIDAICRLLKIQPGKLLEYIPDEENKD